MIDYNSPEFVAEARRQSLLVGQSEAEQKDIAFIEALIEDNLDLPKE